MANDKDNYPFFIPLIWQLNSYPSPSVNSRANLYGVSGIPHTQWGGMQRLVGGGSVSALVNEYKKLYNSIVAQEPQAEITMGLNIHGSTLTVTADITQLETITKRNGPRVFFIITYNRDTEQPGDYFASVVRFVEQEYEPEINIYTQTFEIDSAWDHSKTNVVVIFQEIYRLKEIYNAKQQLLNTAELSIDNDNNIVFDAKLKGNYPNPFNPSTTIMFDVQKTTNVKLEVFNIKGQSVKTLVNTNYDAGRHYTNWDGTDAKGKPVSSGVYLYRMDTENYSELKRMILIK